MKLVYDIVVISLPVIIVIILFFLYKEKIIPKIFFFKLFLYGSIVCVPVIFFEQVLLSLITFSSLFTELYKALIVAGFLEEFAKRFVLLSIVKKKDHYNYLYSGIIFALTTALGFAFCENILDVVFNYHSYDINEYRSLISLSGHIIFSLFMGYYLMVSKSIENKRKRKYFFQLSLFVPIILHGVFDFLIFTKAKIILGFYIIFLGFLFFYNLKKLFLLGYLKVNKK